MRKMPSFMRITVSVLLAIGIVFTTGCTMQPAHPTEAIPQTTKATKPAETTQATEPVPTEPDGAGSSLVSLRQAMVETSQIFAVSYLGYHDTIDSDQPVDPYAVMREMVPQLCAELPFLLQIPEENVVGENGDLFCIVPLDEEATVVVSKGAWDEINEEHIYEECLYSSDSGEPILIFCNNAGWEPDTQLFISGPSGEAIWYPRLDDYLCADPLLNDEWEEMFFDFSPYREMLTAKYRDMQLSEMVMPTEEDLVGTTWKGWQSCSDGRECTYRITFREGVCDVRWNDGIDEVDHEYTDAAWELRYEDDFAVLSIDFQEFAGVLRYNLMYDAFMEMLYVGMDVLEEDMPIGWERLYSYLYLALPPDPMGMVGTWELSWTEVEGYRNEAEPGKCILEITLDDNGLYRISYTDNEFPDWSYYDKELVVFPFALYYGCENEWWSATVNYTGMGGTEYKLTLLEDGTLLLQNYWEVDGAPMVGYALYQKIS